MSGRVSIIGVLCKVSSIIAQNSQHLLLIKTHLFSHLRNHFLTSEKIAHSINNQCLPQLPPPKEQQRLSVMMVVNGEPSPETRGRIKINTYTYVNMDFLRIK